MKKKIFIMIAFIYIFCGLFFNSEAAYSNGKTKTIILKLDDLVYYPLQEVNPNWTRVINYLSNNNIPAGLGLICNSLEKGNKKYFNLIKSFNQQGFDIWFHGYDHADFIRNEKNIAEFKGTSYDYQKDHFEKAMNLAKKKLGITMHTFGAPFNAFDSTTVKVLEEYPEITVWLYGKKSPDSSKMILEHKNVDLEYSTFKLDLSRFKKAFGKSNEPLLVLQGHPGAWNEIKFKEFKKIIEYLVENKVQFTTPYQYYLSVREK